MEKKKNNNKTKKDSQSMNSALQNTRVFVNSNVASRLALMVQEEKVKMLNELTAGNMVQNSDLPIYSRQSSVRSNYSTISKSNSLI